MPINYVDADDLDALLDSNTRAELFTDADDVGTTARDARFLRASQFASSVALSVASQPGYSPAEDTEDDMVRMLALSVLVRFAYGRKQRTLPDDLAAILAPIPEAVRSGDLPLPNEAIANLKEAVGGVGFTESSDSVSTGGASVSIRREPVMRNLANSM